MTSKWTRTKLGDVCQVIAGQSPDGQHYNDVGEGLPFYQGKKEFGFKFLGEPRVWTRQTTKSANAGDIVMSVRAPVGPVNIVSEKCCIGRGLAALQVKPELDRDFLYHFLDMSQDKLMSNEGTVFPSINKAQIEAIEIPLPPLEEQKRIVAKLDEALGDLDQVTENSKSELDQIDALWNAILNTEMSLTASQLGGKEVSLAEIATLVNGRAYKKDELLSEGKYRVLRVGNFFSSSSWYWSNLELDEDKYCDNGDLLYAWSASFGPRVWTEEKVIYHYHIWKVLVDSKVVDRDWLRIWFEWDVDQIKNSAGVGTTMMHVTKGSMESRLIQLPPLGKQKRIVAKLDELKAQIDSLRRARQGKVEEAKSLHSSILSSAFAGDF